MASQDRIRKTAGGLYILTTFVLIALPLGMLVALGMGELGVARVRAAHDHIPMPEVISVASLVVVYAMALVQLALVVVVIWNMRCLFGLYRRVELLSELAALHIRRIAAGLLWLSLAGVLAQSVNVIALTVGNPPGQRMISVGLEPSEIGFFLTGALLLLIGWVMGHAVAVDRENKAFV